MTDFTIEEPVAAPLAVPTIPAAAQPSTDPAVAKMMADLPWVSRAEAEAVVAAERKISGASPQDRVVLFENMRTESEDETFLQSIDNTPPPPSPNAYVHPSTFSFTPEDHQVFGEVRQDFYQAQIPAETGNALISSMHDAATRLSTMTPEQREQWVASETAQIERQYEPAAIEQVRRYVRNTFPPGSAVGRILAMNPEAASSAMGFTALLFASNIAARRGIR